MAATIPSRAQSARSPSDLRIAIFDNLANNAYVQAKVLRRLGHAVDLVLDPLDRYVMSDPRWEDLDMELATDELVDAPLPDIEMPKWIVHRRAIATPSRAVERVKHALGNLARFAMLGSPGRLSLRHAGWRGALMTTERAWVVRTLAGYDCVIAYGMGPAWAGLAGVPCLAQTWGGDITMVPFYDTGDWENHETEPLPAGDSRFLFAQAQLQRFGYARASRLILTDPRFLPYAQRLGFGDKSLHLGFVIDVEKYTPRPEPELRRRLLDGREDGSIVFVPSRQDWLWKGSDRLLRGFAKIAGKHAGAVLVCAGWGADMERSRRLIAELGIGGQVKLMSSAMSKVRLLRHYRAADIVADQFTVGSYGTSALEAMSCARPLLINLDRDRFTPAFSTFPPVMNVSEPDEIAAALDRLLGNPNARRRLGDEARQWVIDNHGTAPARRIVDLCEQAVAERSHRDRVPL